MQELDLGEWNKVEPLFNTHLLAKSVLNPFAHSKIGSLTVDNTNSPTIARYSIPMMIFLAGDSSTSTAEELVKSLPPNTMFVVPDEKWSKLLKNVWGKSLVVNHRMHLDHTTLDIKHLRKLKKNLPEGYTLKKLDLNALSQFNQEYTIQIQMYFGKMENLVKTGIGFCILDDGENLASYAYTPFPFIHEFEIQVYTENSPKYRRKGLATVVSAALIEYGIEKGFIPHWDAANESSTKLALKLGYSSPKTWEAYYYTPKKE